MHKLLAAFLLSVVAVLCQENASWVVSTPSARWSPRGCGKTTVALGNNVYICGGTNGSVAFNDVWISSGGSSWSLVNANASFGARSGACVTSSSPRLLLVGGERRTNGGDATEYLSDVWDSSDGCESLSSVVLTADL